MLSKIQTHFSLPPPPQRTDQPSPQLLYPEERYVSSKIRETVKWKPSTRVLAPFSVALFGGVLDRMIRGEEEGGAHLASFKGLICVVHSPGTLTRSFDIRAVSESREL